MQEYYVGMRYRSVVISIDCPCRKTDDDDDDDKYGVRSTSVDVIGQFYRRNRK